MHSFLRSVFGGTLMLTLLLIVIFSVAFMPASLPLAAVVIPEYLAARSAESATSALVTSPFYYTFNADGKLREAGTLSESSSPYWWVNSGAYLFMENGIGKTAQGALPLSDPWRLVYALSNPTDTDNGAHPQNIFRLVSRATWGGNSRVEASFRVTADNFSKSPNRNASNGLLLMQRYQEGGNTLYYAGVRVDGTAIIKKKYRGAYYTLAQQAVFPGTYVKGGSTNLLPHDEWLTLRSDLTGNPDGSLTSTLYLKRENQTAWTKIAEAKDTGGTFGGSPVITSAGLAGVRTDFMDVELDTIRILKL